METNEQKAFDFAADTTKQLITLSTAIIALTITFSKDIIGASNITNSSSIFWAWGLFIASVIFGIWTLMALTGTLQPMKNKSEPKKEDTNDENSNDTSEVKQQSTETTNDEPFNINGFNVKLPAGLQILTFISALIFTVNFGITSIKSSKENPKLENNTKNTHIEIIRRTEYEIIKPIIIDTVKVKK